MLRTSTAKPHYAQVESAPVDYSLACPRCGARPGGRCVSSGHTYWRGHRERRAARQQFKPSPELVRWWKSMRPYEGECYAKAKRSPDYRVPSNAEIMAGAS